MAALHAIDQVLQQQADERETPEVFVNGCNVQLVARKGEILTVEPGVNTRKSVLEQIALATRTIRGKTQYLLDLGDASLSFMLVREPAAA